MSVNRTENTVRSHYTWSKQYKWSILGHETKTYETDTSISRDRGRGQDCETETKTFKSNQIKFIKHQRAWCLLHVAENI